MQYTFRRIIPTSLDWQNIESTYDTTVYKTKCWFEYLQTLNCEPFVCEVNNGGGQIGYFAGEILHRVVPIVGSPFEGIGTAQQGLSMLRETDAKERLEIYRQLADWIFEKRYAVFLQIEDWQLRMDDMTGSELHFEPRRVKYIDLTPTEDELYKNMHQDCKYSIRKAIKNGIVIRETQDVEHFLTVFYRQMSDVYDKQGLKIAKSREWYQKVVSAVYPTNMMLLEAVTQEGEIAATGMILLGGGYAATWQTASERKYQSLRPNELLRWEAMRLCKQRGATVVNMCGTQAYKDKFGAQLVHIPRLIFCKWQWLIEAKNIAKRLYYKYRQQITQFKKE